MKRSQTLALELRKRRRSKSVGARVAKLDPLTGKELTVLLDKNHAIMRGDKTLFPQPPLSPAPPNARPYGLTARRGARAKVGRVDWRGGFLYVQRADVRCEVAGPKSGKNRCVYMTAELKDTLRAVYREQFERVAAIDAEKQAALESEQAATADSWMFTDTEGEMIDGDNFRRRVFGPLLTAAELRKVRIHDLRHGYASLLIAAGKPVMFAQQQLLGDRPKPASRDRLKSGQLE